MFITFEGPIGVGKSTLMQAASEALGGVCFADPVEKVSRFHGRAAPDPLATETEFLYQRLLQLEDIGRVLEEGNRPVIADWDLRKVRYFGAVELDRSDDRILQRLAALVEANAPRPDIFVLIQAPAGIIRERIVRRGRPFEQSIDEKQIERMIAAFSEIVDRLAEDGRTTVIRFENRDGIDQSAVAVVERLRAILEGLTP